MNSKKFTRTLLGGAIAATLIVSANLAAQDVEPVINPIVVQESATLVTFAGGTAKSGGFIKIRVAGPKGYTVFESSSKTGLIDWVLESGLPDGRYNYDVWFTPAGFVPRELRAERLGHRPNRKGYTGPKPAYHAGAFVIHGGVLQPQRELDPSPGRELSAAHAAPSALERLVGSALTWVVAPAAAQDVLIDNPTPDVSFEDTDSDDAGGMTQWEIGVREGSGTADGLFIINDDFVDFSNAVGMFVIEESAPDNSLFIESGGQVGMGTSTPEAKLDVVGSLFPSIRLADSGSSEWRMVAGTDFCVSIPPSPPCPPPAPDALTFSYLGGGVEDPAFSILALGGTGNVGVGTINPDAALHVQRAAGTQLRVENTGAGDGTNDIMFRLTNASADIIRFVMKNASSSWTFDNAGNLFRIALVGGSTTPEFTVDNNGDGHFRGDVYANGIKLTSSRALKTGFTPVDEATLLAKVAALDISQWRYKSEPETAQHIGPMAEQFQAVFGLGDGKHLEMVDTTGIAFAAIQALEAKNTKLEARLVAQNEVLKARLRAIEAQMAALDE